MLVSGASGWMIVPSVCFDGLYFVEHVGCGFACGVVVTGGLPW